LKSYRALWRKQPSSPGPLPSHDAGLVMDREDRIARELVEQPFFDHHSAAAALFGRLKDQVHGAFEIASGGEVLGRAEQHRRVSVMAAGVHPTVGSSGRRNR
jgi:hypothetical protein